MTSHFLGIYSEATLVFTQQYGSIPTLDQITSGITDISLSADWTNVGSGTWSYTGPSRLFYAACSVSQESSDTPWSGCVTIKKNDANLAGSNIKKSAIGLTNSIAYFGNANRNGHVELLLTDTTVKNLSTMGPYIFNPNDEFTAHVGGAQNPDITGISLNFEAEFHFLSYP